MRTTVSAFDDAVDSAFATIRNNRAADTVAYAASQAADYSIAWHVISVAMAVVSPSRRRHALRLAVVLGLESILVNGILKRATRRPRPALLDDRAFEVRRPATTSFPSGHASSAALSAVLLTDAMPRGRRLWVLLALIVGASRIHNRMHHASDVAAGAVLGTAFGVLTKRFWPLR
ncbi:MAG: phosphatase PAP2 family protein [Actinomycetota bacterium]